MNKYVIENSKPILVKILPICPNILVNQCELESHLSSKFAAFNKIFMSSAGRNKVNRFFQGFRHVVMGLLLILLGVIVAHYQRFGTIELSDVTSYSLAGIMVLYGLFRIWRGVKEFKDDQTNDFIT